MAKREFTVVKGRLCTSGCVHFTCPFCLNQGDVRKETAGAPIFCVTCEETMAPIQGVITSEAVFLVEWDYKLPPVSNVHIN